MKRIAASLVFVVAAGTAQADGMSDPIVEPAVIAEAATASSAPSAGFILGLMTLVVFGTAAAN